MRRSRGFTLMEVVAALAVMAILLMLALPSYIDKIVREQIADALPLADLAKGPVESAWRSSQDLPASNEAAGLPPADKIVNNVVRSVRLEAGAVHIVFGNKAHGRLKDRTLTLRPAGVDDARVVPVTWLCGYAAAPEKMTAQGGNRTDIPAGYLPLRCRAG